GSANDNAAGMPGDRRPQGSGTAVSTGSPVGSASLQLRPVPTTGPDVQESLTPRSCLGARGAGAPPALRPRGARTGQRATTPSPTLIDISTTRRYQESRGLFSIRTTRGRAASPARAASPGLMRAVMDLTLTPRQIELVDRARRLSVEHIA